MNKPATFILLIALVALIAVCGYLVVSAPVIYRARTQDKFLSSDGRLAVIFSQSPLFDATPKAPDQYELTAVDLETGEVTIFPYPPGNIRPRVDDAGNLFLLHCPPDSKSIPLGTPQPTRLTTIDSTCSRIETSSEFLFPSFSTFTPIGNRFLVAVEGNRIHVLDSHDIQRGIKSIAVTSGEHYVSEVPQSNRFYHVNVVTPKGPVTAAGPNTGTIDLYQINDRGAARQIASWPVGTQGTLHDMVVDCSEHQFYSLSPDLKNIECRSTLDGQLESTFSVPEGFDPTTNYWLLLMSVLYVESAKECRFFDLVGREWLPHLEGNAQVRKFSKDRRFLYYLDNARWCTLTLYDRLPDTQRGNQAGAPKRTAPHLVGEFLVDRGAKVEWLDSDRLVVLSDRHGFSVRFIDIASGETMRVIKPLGWVRPLLIIVMLGYAAWCVAWMINSARGGGWAWIDVLLVGGVPLLMMVARMVMRGHALEISRLPVRFALGGAMLELSF